MAKMLQEYRLYTHTTVIGICTIQHYLENRGTRHAFIFLVNDNINKIVVVLVKENA